MDLGINKSWGKKRELNVNCEDNISCHPPRPSFSTWFLLSWSLKMRELRHSKCLMTPIMAFMALIMVLLFSLGLIFQLPGFFIGLLMSPLSRRFHWFIEFLYPTGLARWIHILIMKWGSKRHNAQMSIPIATSNLSNSFSFKNKLNKKILMHSRSIEQRTEVVRNRVYIHPLPQLLDNVGYLIICLPSIDRHQCNYPILGLIVDCGDATSVLSQVELIRDVHYRHKYPESEMEVHALLSTHRHHDHTAGNRALLQKCKSTLKCIYGGAVDNVPYCTRFVRNGDFLKLPCVKGNNMNRFVTMECIAVPSHTRGSIVYALRPNVDDGFVNKSCEKKFSNKIQGGVDKVIVGCHLFTGDALFSGGGGVPFESDLEFPRDNNKYQNLKGYSCFKPSAGKYGIERCFAEIILRATASSSTDQTCHSFLITSTDCMLVYPGHEYTLDLLQRQFDQANDYNGKWCLTDPSTFFELASHFLVAQHRRNLPKVNRLLTVPTSIRRELKINPYFRSLKRRGEHVIVAIQTWYKYVARLNMDEDVLPGVISSTTCSKFEPNCFSYDPTVDHSNSSTWSMDHIQLNKSVFTTVYTSDLHNIICNLNDGSISPLQAAIELTTMTQRLEEKTITRRPIPGMLPGERSMFLGLVALAVLGSAPSALTASDGECMNLPVPVDSSDFLIISKSRLLSVLRMLGLIENNTYANNTTGENNIKGIVHMFHVLWKEAYICKYEINKKMNCLVTKGEETENDEEKNGSEIEDCCSSVAKVSENDEVELGMLKLALYRVPYSQPTWFYKLCNPCGEWKDKLHDRDQILESNIKNKSHQSNGELVKHDIRVCPMCCDIIGCPYRVNMLLDGNNLKS